MLRITPAFCRRTPTDRGRVSSPATSCGAGWEVGAGLDYPPAMRSWRRAIPVLLVFAFLLSGCGDRLAQRDGETQLQWGERLSGQLGCPACHSPSGARLQGPPMGQQWLGEVHLRSGDVVIRDEAYIRSSIIAPSSQVLADYFPVMVPYADLTEEQLDALVAFWKDRSLPAVAAAGATD